MQSRARCEWWGGGWNWWFAAHYLGLRLLLQRGAGLKPAVAQQTVSMIHASTALTLAARVCWVEGYAPLAANSAIHELMLGHSTAYFAVDALGLCTIDPWSLPYWLHHVAVLNTMTAVHRLGYGGNTIAWALLVGEISNPIGRAKAIWLHRGGGGGTPHYRRLQALYRGAFVAARGVGMPAVVWALHRDLAGALPPAAYRAYFAGVAVVGVGSAVWALQMLWAACCRPQCASRLVASSNCGGSETPCATAAPSAGPGRAQGAARSARARGAAP